MNDWEQRRKRIKDGLEGLQARLLELGVKTVTIHYDGSGDEGSVGSVLLDGKFTRLFKSGYKPASNEFLLHKQDELLVETIEEFAYEKLEDVHDGWEINEGSFGEIVLDVVTWEISGTHNERYESYETSEW